MTDLIQERAMASTTPPRGEQRALGARPTQPTLTSESQHARTVPGHYLLFFSNAGTSSTKYKYAWNSPDCEDLLVWAQYVTSASLNNKEFASGIWRLDYNN